MSLRTAWSRQQERATGVVDRVVASVEPLFDDSTVRVNVCRGCCCGTDEKHADVDHDGQLAAVSAVARTRVVDCVDECSHSNVVIVRVRRGRSTWLGDVNSSEATAALCDWLADGAPQPPPPILEERVIPFRGRTSGRGGLIRR